MPYTYAYPRPSVTVDCVVFGLDGLELEDLKVLLIERGREPFAGCWALPGGFVDMGEDLETAARRELEEETGVTIGYLEQLYTFGAPYRDPRMRVISVAWCALIRPDLAPLVTAGTDARDAQWWSLTQRPALAFDHNKMVSMALDRVRGKLDYTPIAFELVPPTFTISELREVFEAIKGGAYDRGNFRRRFNRMLQDETIILAPGKRQTASRPARVYAFNRSR